MNMNATSILIPLQLAILFALLPATNADAQQGSGSDYVSNQLYVKLRPETSVGDMERVRRELAAGGLEVSAIRSFGSGSLPEPKNTELSGGEVDRRLIAEYLLARLLVVTYRNDLHPARATRLLADVDIVLLAEPVPIPHTFGSGTPAEPNDPMIPDQKQLSAIRAEEAWQIETGDTGVVVGVVDAGITARHEDLWDNIAINWGEAGVDLNGNPRESNGVDDDANGYVDDWKGVNLTPTDEIPPGETNNGEHGTQVTGYTGATTDNELGIAGVGNQCRFFPIKGARYRTDAMVGGYNGILYAARRGFSVVNCSWGQPVNSVVEQEIIDLAVYAYDIAIVAAGGNDGGYLRYYPAGYRNVLGVAGMNDLQYVTTAWGEHIDVVSRAGLTTSDLNLYYDLSSASSYAAPVVSGVIALVRSHWPELSAQGAMLHVRNTSVPIDVFNLGRESLIGRGKVDALNALSTDPFSVPGLIIDSVWAVDAEGVRTDSLREGETGEIRFSITNVLGPATDVRLRAVLYSDDSSTVSIAVDSLMIGDLAPGQNFVSVAGFPVAILGPGRRDVAVRFELRADNFSDHAYEFVPIRRTYTVLRGEEIVLTITANGKPAVDYSEGTAVGEGVTWNGVQMIYEGGLIVATDSRHVLDNVRAGNPARPNDDLRPISPAVFPVEVTAATEDRAGAQDHIGVRVGTRGELFEEYPDLMRIGLFVENRSGVRIDSLRIAMFADWDLDGVSEGQSVDTVDHAGLDRDIYPVVGRISSGFVSNVFIALEQGIRRDTVTPLFHAILNGGDPLVIFDGFSDEEKYRTVSSGIGNPASGPGDISLVIGGVIPDLAAGEVDSIFILAAFTDLLEIPENVYSYTDAVYGSTSVPGSGPDTRPTLTLNENPVSSVATLHGEGIRGVRLIDASGREILARSVEVGVGTLSIPTSGVPSGAYWLLVVLRDRVESVPLIVVQ